MIIPISIVIPYCIIKNEVYLWTQIRESSDQLNGLIEFPGGKVESEESPVDAGLREVLEETGVQLHRSLLTKFKNYSFESHGKTIMLMVFIVHDQEKQFAARGDIKLKNLINMPERIPPANQEILLDLKAYFE